jgi:sorbitol-specific phosphotransferase system component IIBC
LLKEKKILLRKGPIEAELGAHDLQLLLGCVFARKALRGVAAENVEKRERQQRDADQDRNHIKRAAKGVGENGALLFRLAWRAVKSVLAAR